MLRWSSCGSFPETNLFYPGSAVLHPFGLETTGFEARRNPTHAGFLLGTQATADEVEAFYTSELPRLGWTKLGGAYNARTSSEARGRAWRKGNLIFRFAVVDTAAPLAPSVGGYVTGYEIRVRNLMNDGT